MPARRTDPDAPRSDSWTAAALLALLGVAFATDYLFPENERIRGRGRENSPRRSQPVPLHSTDGVGVGQADRGCQATGPSETPAPRWHGGLLRIYGSVSRHRIMALAAGMTYYSILAIFPAIAALVAMYGLFSDPSTIARHLDQLGGLLPNGAIEIAREQLTRVAAKGSQTLGVTFALGLGVSLWSANAAMKSLFDTLNIVYGEDEKRGFVRLNVTSLAFTISGIVFVMAALGSIVIIPIILNYIGFSDVGDLLLRLGRWPLMYLILTFALAIIYRYGPSRDAPQWRWITWGSALAALLWLGVSALFSWYAASFGNFNETYGSLGAVVGFMTWLWISAIVTLLGAEIDAELEHRNAPTRVAP
jgi:membrane protein